MGNKSSSVQTLVQEMYNKLTLKSEATAVGLCVIKKINIFNVDNCNLVLSNDCYATANANLDAVQDIASSAIQQASQEQISGLALSFNSAENRQSVENKVRNIIDEGCNAKAIVTAEISDIVIGATDTTVFDRSYSPPRVYILDNGINCGGGTIEIKNVTSADAVCALTSLFKAVQETGQKAEQKQTADVLRFLDSPGCSNASSNLIIIISGLVLVIGGIAAMAYIWQQQKKKEQTPKDDEEDLGEQQKPSPAQTSAAE